MPAPNSREVKFTIVVCEQGVEELKRVVAEVNDPASSKYGQFLTQVELDRLTSPTASDASTVTYWLARVTAWTFTLPDHIEH